MKFAWTLGALGLILLASWWGLDSWLEPRALAIWSGEQYQSEAKGWDIVLTAWPLMVSFGVILAVVFTVIFGEILKAAIKADSEAEINKLRVQAENSEKNAQRAREELLKAQSQANANAKSHAQVVLGEANAIKQRAEQFYQETQSYKSEMLNQVEQAQAERDQMAACLLETDAKRQRAESFSIRFKRKALKVQDELWAYLDERFQWSNKEKSMTEIQQIFEPIVKQTDKTMYKPKPNTSPCMELARGLGQRPR